MKMELRINESNITANEDGSMTVAGYVNETEKFSNFLGREKMFKEVIKRGAWTKAIDRAKEIHFLAEHDNKKILASTRNDSLKLHEDERGLYMEATISPTSWGKDYYQLIKDGILNNMSFGFKAVKDTWSKRGTHFERTVDDLELFEVSVVRDPAYPASSISARGIDLVEEMPEEEVTKLETEERELDLGIDYHIRSEEDIEILAKKILEYIEKANKVAEGHEDEVETEVKETEDETEVIADLEEVITETVEEEVATEEVKTEEVEETEVEETKVEEVVEDQPVAVDAAAKLREFIVKHKQEEI